MRHIFSHTELFLMNHQIYFMIRASEILIEFKLALIYISVINSSVFLDRLAVSRSLRPYRLQRLQNLDSRLCSVSPSQVVIS